MNPTKSILDRTFRYKPSGATDVAATFRRIRREMADAERVATAVAHERIAKVRKLGGR